MSEACWDATCPAGEAVVEALLETGLWPEIDGDGTGPSILADHIRQLARHEDDEAHALCVTAEQYEAERAEAERLRELRAAETGADVSIPVQRHLDAHVKALQEAQYPEAVQNLAAAAATALARAVANGRWAVAEHERANAAEARLAEAMRVSNTWTATGGGGTATVVSRIGGPSFAVLRHGKPALGLAEMVAAALNACPWLTEPEAADRVTATGTEATA